MMTTIMMMMMMMKKEKTTKKKTEAEMIYDIIIIPIRSEEEGEVALVVPVCAFVLREYCNE